jgi:uncharacterized protein with HEPN domain
MPPTVEDRLRDILEAIIEIEDMLTGSSLDQFSADKMRRMATERYPEVICEATRKLTDEVKRDAPNIDWRKMIDLEACCGTPITQRGSIPCGTSFRMTCRP